MYIYISYSTQAHSTCGVKEKKYRVLAPFCTQHPPRLPRATSLSLPLPLSPSRVIPHRLTTDVQIEIHVECLRECICA